MKVLIVGIIVLALAVAGVSTYLIQSFGGEENLEELQKQAQKPKIKVLIATRDMRPGEVLKAENMAWQVWVEEALNKQFVVVDAEEQESAKIKDFEGGIVRRSIIEGEPLLASKIFKSDKPAFLAGVLSPGMRAVSFTTTEKSAASGFILPGDRVDILLTHDKLRAAIRRSLGGKPEAPDEPLMVLKDTTETIMRDVKVLAVNQQVDLEEGTTIKAKTITLELTPKRAELLITARGMGKLSWVLRSLQNAPQAAGDTAMDKPSFTTDVEVSPVLKNFEAIIKAHRAEALAKKRVKKRVKKPVKKKLQSGKVIAAPPPPPPVSVVKIYRGGDGNLQEIKGKQ